MGEIDDLESIADILQPDRVKNRLTPKGRAACRAGMLKALQRAQSDKKSAIGRLVNSAKARRQHKSAPITLAPIRGGAS